MFKSIIQALKPTPVPKPLLEAVARLEAEALLEAEYLEAKNKLAEATALAASYTRRAAEINEAVAAGQLILDKYERVRRSITTEPGYTPVTSASYTHVPERK